MTLTELKTAVDRAMDQAKRCRNNPDEITVGVVIHNPNTVGGAPLAGVKSVHMGIDWDARRCLIWPDAELAPTLKNGAVDISDHRRKHGTVRAAVRTAALMEAYSLLERAEVEGAMAEILRLAEMA